MAGAENVAIMQDSAAHAKDVPPEIRTGFVVKVYCIVISMLLVSFGIASPCVFYQDWADKYLKEHPWIMYTCIGFLLVQHLFHVVMMMEMCCGGANCIKAYVKMFVTVPFNYLYLFMYATFMGGAIGIVCLSYQATSICLVFGLCVVVVGALTVYAVCTKSDFTGMGAYILVALVGLLLTGVVGMFVPMGSIYHRVAGGLGSIVFGWIIVYDTQLIFGSATPSGGSRKYEYTIDMYAFAAFELYLDFVNFFFYMLQLLGDRR